MVIEDLILGGPKPIKGIDPSSLENVTMTTTSENIINTPEKKSCNCGKCVDSNCNCNKSNGSKCNCKSKKNIGEMLLKISIGLAVITAGYLLIKK